MISSNKNKIILEDHQIQFIKDNHSSMTNKELADHLGFRLTSFRKFLYNMGLKRMELEYWTQEQIDFLKDHYKTIGDTELAEIFETKWYKKKSWTKKHIEKKRRYLKLKRTKAQIKAIHKRNTIAGRFKICNEKMWKKRGVSPNGTIKVWITNNRPTLVIKTNKGFVHYNRWLYENEIGPIPQGMCVRVMSDDPLEYTAKDLKLVTRAENSILNNTASGYPASLQQLILLTKQLEKQINNENRN